MPSSKAHPETLPLLNRPPVSTSFLTSELGGYAYMLSGALCWALLSFFVHIGAVKYNFPTTASIIMRAAVTLLLSSLYIVVARDVSMIPSRAQLLPLAARSLAGTIGCLCIFTALKYIPVASATTIFCTSPVITTVLSAIFLHEPVTRVDVFALVSSFVGVVFVAQPPFLFPSTSYPIMISNNHLFGVFCAFIAAVCASTVYTLVRSMGLRVHFILNVITLGIGLSILSLFLATPSDLHHFVHNRPGVLMNLLGGLSGFGCVASFSRGLQFCRAGPGMVFRTTDIPISFFLGYFFLGEHLSALSAVGVFLVISAALVLAVRGARNTETTQ